jgi:hypothetical protein
MDTLDIRDGIIDDYVGNTGGVRKKGNNNLSAREPNYLGNDACAGNARHIFIANQREDIHN